MSSSISSISSILTPLTFTGVSQFSSDFQTILSHAVQVAQIPVTQLQNRDSNQLQEKTLLSGLSTDVANLASSLQSLGTVAANQAVSATTSDGSIVTATATGSANPGSYTINSITSLAAAASERTSKSYADSSSTPVSSHGPMELVVGSHSYDFTLASNSLIGLRDQINSLGAGVTASILTTGNGNYLSIQANSTGATTLKLIDDPKGAAANLLTSTNQGSDAQFQLNGIDITQGSNFVNNVIPGVTFDLLAQSSSKVTISLQSDPSQLASALQTFVSNYNQLSSDLSAQTGQAGGLLTGDLVITQLQSLMRSLAAYTNASGSIHSLSDLGITFDSSGKASIDSSTLSSLNDAQIHDAFAFVGSASSGLAAFSSSLSQFSDPVTGLIKIEQDGITRTDQSLQTQISTLTSRINAMQTSLQQQLAAADTLEAGLQAQQQTLTSSLQGLNLVLFGKNTTAL